MSFLLVLFQEKETIINSHKERAGLVSKTLNQIEGISCNEVTGAFYALPKIELPRKAVEAAKVISTGETLRIYFQTRTFFQLKVFPYFGSIQRIMGSYSLSPSSPGLI